MRSAPVVLALLLLLPSRAAALPECAEALLRVELSPEPRETPEVCLSPGQETAFRTSTRLLPNGARVEPAGRPLEWAVFPQGVVFFTSNELTLAAELTRQVKEGSRQPLGLQELIAYRVGLQVALAVELHNPTLSRSPQGALHPHAVG